MTVVNVNFAVPASAKRGFLTWQRAERTETGDVTILRAMSSAPLVDGVGVIDIAPGYYVFTENVPGGQRVARLVPANGPVAYTDLVEVDPATLQPAASPPGAWWLELDTLKAGLPGTEGNEARLQQIEADVSTAAGVPDTPLAARLRAEDSAARAALEGVITESLNTATIDCGSP